MKNSNNQRAELLANNLLQGAEALRDFAQTLSDIEWNTPVNTNGDARTYGLVIHHVASVYPVEIELAQVLASGNPIVGVTNEVVDEMNAKHAIDNSAATKESTLELLKRNSEDAADTIRKFSDGELNSCHPVSLYGDAPLTAQFFIEDHAMRHSYHHLSKLKESRIRQ